jgi:DNA-binding transcriptional MerR regulator
MNRVYSYKDRARLQLILRGKRVGLALSEIGEILDLYELGDGCATQNAISLAKFRERIRALESQRRDIDMAVDVLQEACARLESQLKETRPDLLEQPVEAIRPRRPRPGEMRRAG